MVPTPSAAQCRPTIRAAIGEAGNKNTAFFPRGDLEAGVARGDDVVEHLTAAVRLKPDTTYYAPHVGSLVSGYRVPVPARGFRVLLVAGLGSCEPKHR